MRTKKTEISLITNIFLVKKTTFVTYLLVRVIPRAGDGPRECEFCHFRTDPLSENESLDAPTPIPTLLKMTFNKGGVQLKKNK